MNVAVCLLLDEDRVLPPNLDSNVKNDIGERMRIRNLLVVVEDVKKVGRMNLVNMVAMVLSKSNAKTITTYHLR